MRRYPQVHSPHSQCSEPHGSQKHWALPLIHAQPGQSIALVRTVFFGSSKACGWVSDQQGGAVYPVGNTERAIF